MNKNLLHTKMSKRDKVSQIPLVVYPKKDGSNINTILQCQCDHRLEYIVQATSRIYRTTHFTAN